MLKLLSKRGRAFFQHPRLVSTVASTGSGRLEGKVALITGGASGLGKAATQEFVKQGAHVFIADINDKQGQDVAQDLGPNAQFIHCNVGIEDHVARAVDTAFARHKKLDIMYNNVGILGPFGPPSIIDLDLDQFDRVLWVNVRGTMAGIKHATRVMKPVGSGSILCTASTCGLLGGLGPHPYSISKFTIPGIVKSLASELCQYGIRINCISPNVVETPPVINYFKAIYPKATSDQITKIVEGIGELKGAKCEDMDMAKAALYLCSDDAKYVSGHNLVVDGGFTCMKTPALPSPDELIV